MKSHHNLVTSLSLSTLDIKPEGIPTQSYSLPERQPAVERLVITKVLNNLSEKGDEIRRHKRMGNIQVRMFALYILLNKGSI